MRIGLYGGTFDPPHFGHLLLAEAAAEAARLDLVLFIPAALNPLKEGGNSTPGEIRAALVQAAIEDNPLFQIDTRELQQPPPSFTILTIEAIAKERPEAALFLIVGADHVSTLPLWERADDIKRMVSFIWLGRPGFERPPSDPSSQLVYRLVDVSASEIRNRVASGLSIRYMVPEKVRMLIETQNLYMRIPSEKRAQPSVGRP